MSDSDRLSRLTNGPYRQSEDGYIESSDGNQWGVRVNGRSEIYSSVGGTWLDADNYPGETARLAFVQGNPLLPIFFSRATKPGAIFVPGGEIAPLVLAWYCEQADFKRSQSQLITELGTEALIEATPPDGRRYHRTYEQFRVKLTFESIRVPLTPGSNSPYAEWFFDSLEAEDALGLLDGGYEAYYVANIGSELTEDQVRNHYINGSFEKSLCIVDSKIYLEIQYEIESVLVTTYDPGEETEYTEEESDYNYQTMLFCFSADPPADDMELLWSYLVDTQTYGDREDASDIVVTGGRCVILCSGYETLPHIDADTGLDLQEISLSGIIFDNNLPTDYAAKIGNRWKTIYAIESRVWFGGRGIGLTCVDLLENAIVWTQEDSNSLISYHPLGFAGSQLICVKHEETRETITDYRYSCVKWDEELLPFERSEVARGHSQVGSLVSINPLTGIESGSSVISGTESAGDLSESITDYYTEVVYSPWSDTWNPAPPLPGMPESTPYTDANTPGGLNYQISDFGRVLVPLLAEYYSQELTDAWQDTNETGTYIEGEQGPEIGGTVYGDFNNARGAAVNFYGAPYSGTYVWQAERDQRSDDLLRERVTRAPGDITVTEQNMVDVEQSRTNNGDWGICDKFQTYMSSVAIFDTDVDPITGELVEYSPESFTVTQCIKTSRLSTGTAAGGPLQWRNPGGQPIPSFPFPEYGDPISTWSDEYIALWEAWDGNPATRPYKDRVRIGYSGPSPTGGNNFTIRHRVVFRPIPDLVAKLRTPPPPLSLGPTCATNSLLILGPDGSATSMSWVAVNGSGAIAWEANLAKDAFPGPPVAVGLTGGGVGIVTCYNFDGDHWVCILDAADGSVLHDALVPPDGGDVILDTIVIDSAIWSLNSAYGISE